MLQKSATTSGVISRALPSLSRTTSFLLSMNVVSLLFLSNHIILAPDVASRTLFIFFLQVFNCPFDRHSQDRWCYRVLFEISSAPFIELRKDVYYLLFFHFLIFICSGETPNFSAIS